METKVCKECGQSLPKSNFSKNKATKDGLANYCKKCDKERRRKSSGGITQQGKCLTLMTTCCLLNCVDVDTLENYVIPK